ncbi:MAG: hypothetical protein WBP03_01630 [Candidatus Saccharimonadales bacterium]
MRHNPLGGARGQWATGPDYKLAVKRIVKPGNTSDVLDMITAHALAVEAFQRANASSAGLPGLGGRP